MHTRDVINVARISDSDPVQLCMPCGADFGSLAWLVEVSFCEARSIKWNGELSSGESSSPKPVITSTRRGIRIRLPKLAAANFGQTFLSPR